MSKTTIQLDEPGKKNVVRYRTKGEHRTIKIDEQELLVSLQRSSRASFALEGITFTENQWLKTSLAARRLLK